MNINFGGFNDSLKYSYQQFCKNDAEAREHSRQLLLRLDRFENKSQELAANTQIAEKMKNQYERRLMQENPLLWSQIQRSLAILDYPEINQHLPSTAGIHHHHGPVNTNSAEKKTREMAINTSNSSHSSVSEQPSLHEDGVWAHSPSPMPDVQTSFANMKISIADHHHNNNPTAVASHITTPTKSVLPTSRILQSFPPPSNKIPESPTEVKPQQFPFQMTRFSPVSSSTPNFNQIKPPQTMPSEEKSEQRQEPIDYEPEEKTKSLENELLDTAGNTETLPMHNEPVAIVESPKPSVTPVIKPFRLDSESEGASEGGGFSGPPTHNAADDDSDSFWN